jgi:1-acyl-sn-glycerol-3-phosphate acyltransferase
MKWALGLLESGNALAVFPEGTRNPQGLGNFNSGAALLHLRSEAPILPVAITGTAHLISSARIFFPTGTIKVRVGEPFALNTKGFDTKRESLEEMTRQIMQKIAVLLPASYHGVYTKGKVSD